MSWKSFVTAGLLCVLATPVFAAPQIRIVPGGTEASGHLNAAGNWIWNVQVAPDISLTPNAGPTPNTTPLAVELGLQLSGASLVSVTAPNNAVWDKINPGTAIPSFSGGSHASCGAAYNNNPCGLQFNAAAGSIFAAFGSVNLTDNDFETLLQIETTRPMSGSLSSTVQVLGAYAGEGLVAQVTGYNQNADNKYNATAYDGFVHAGVTREARLGDINLNGTVDGNDFLSFAQNYPAASGKTWQTGDFSGNGSTDGNDFLLFAQNYPSTYSVGAGATINGTPAGAGSASGSAVPEPASLALVGLALVGGMGLVRRKR